MLKEHNILEVISKSILAGLLISLAGIVFIKAPNSIVGSILFSFGLIGVILLQANLFTGKVGYINTKDKLIDSCIILLVNLVTAFIVGLIFRASFGTQLIMTAKLAKSWYQVLLDGIGCGALIYLAVEGYKKSKSILLVIICVVAFILGGFEHCIADAFYFGACDLTWKGFAYIMLIVLGNSLGSLILRFLQTLFVKENI